VHGHESLKFPESDAVYTIYYHCIKEEPVPVALRPLACWDCGFEFHRWHGCLL